MAIADDIGRNADTLADEAPDRKLPRIHFWRRHFHRDPRRVAINVKAL